MHEVLYAKRREAAAPGPTAAIIVGQSVRAAARLTSPSNH